MMQVQLVGAADIDPKVRQWDHGGGPLTVLNVNPELTIHFSDLPAMCDFAQKILAGIDTIAPGITDQTTWRVGQESFTDYMAKYKNYLATVGEPAEPIYPVPPTRFMGDVVVAGNGILQLAVGLLETYPEPGSTVEVVYVAPAAV